MHSWSRNTNSIPRGNSLLCRLLLTTISSISQRKLKALLQAIPLALLAKMLLTCRDRHQRNPLTSVVTFLVKIWKLKVFSQLMLNQIKLIWSQKQLRPLLILTTRRKKRFWLASKEHLVLKPNSRIHIVHIAAMKVTNVHNVTKHSARSICWTSIPSTSTRQQPKDQSLA